MWRSPFILLACLLCGCAIEVTGPKRHVLIGIPKPRTNAIVAVAFTKIGIIAQQNPATGSPEVTLGYQRGYYYGIPLYATNWIPHVRAGVVTEQSGLKTTITDFFEAGTTNAP